MDISGKLFQVLPEQSGEGKNGRWVKCDFVIDLPNEKYPKKVCITAWSEQVETVKNLSVGTDLKVSFDISSREYNGRWYTDVKAWKIEVLGGGSQPSNNNNYSNRSTASAEPAANLGSNERYVSEDDLPF
jgi:hypothetical protein